MIKAVGYGQDLNTWVASGSLGSKLGRDKASAVGMPVRPKPTEVVATLTTGRVESGLMRGESLVLEVQRVDKGDIAAPGNSDNIVEGVGWVMEGSSDL